MNIEKEPRKTKRISVRFTESEYELIRKTALDNLCKKTDLVRSAVRKLICESENIQ